MVKRLRRRAIVCEVKAAALVIGKQDASLAEPVFQHPVHGAQVLEDFSLKPVDPAGRDQEQQLPRLKKYLHVPPDAR